MYLVVFLFLILNAFSQPGPVQINEAGISNYQIQGSEPTTTPITGKQYLYNSNSVIKTKDSIGRFKRVNDDPENFVPNFDLEEGILPFVFTAGTTVLNTVNPLQGLRSIDFNPTLQNDFVETPLITIPPILMNGTCMIRVNIRGSDANTKLSVINGAGTEIGFKQLAVFADSTPQFITFNCPTQALITATPQLGQLKIKLVQSTATNAALATLDSFYLGRFESNTMTVQEQPQWYYYTAATDINGNFTFPAPTASTNDKTLFNYGAGILTALKPAKLTIEFSAWSGANAISVSSITEVNCTISGVARMVSQQHDFTSATSRLGGNVSGTILLNVGDTCLISINRGGLAFNVHAVNITATPLPQLATIVNTNTPRAGFLAKKTYTAGCTWTRTSATLGPFPANAACAAGAIMEGLTIADAVNNGQLPALTLSKLPKARIQVLAYGRLNGASGSDTYYAVALNGVAVTGNTHQGGPTAQVGQPVRVWEFNNSSELTNAKLELWAFDTVAGGVNIFNGTAALTLVVYAFPDISDPYSIPELYAALPPQVINSSGKIWRSESCKINNAGTATLSSASCNTWVGSVNRTGAGLVTVNFIASIFSIAPECTIIANHTGGNAYCALQGNPSSTVSLATTNCFSTNTATNVDSSFNINCQGFTN